MSYIFGPVRSRRFGLSLGIDLSPSGKQCNFDCLYCELKPKRAEPKMTQIAEVGAILSELEEAIPRFCGLDAITITANGEPTLYPHLHALITGIKQLKGSQNLETLILSNGSRFGEKDVQEALCEFDMVKFSLDAVSPKVFKRIDRACSAFSSITTIIEGIKDFAARYKGELIAEVLFVAGVNDGMDEACAIAKVLREIAPVRVDLSTIDRPSAYPVHAISPEKLEELAGCFEGLCCFIAKRQNGASTGIAPQKYSKEELLNTLAKRPWSEDDVRTLLDGESQANFWELLECGEIERKMAGKLLFFGCKNP